MTDELDLRALLEAFRPLAADRARRWREYLRLEEACDRAFISGIEAHLGGDARRERREHAVFADAQTRLDDERDKLTAEEKHYREFEHELAQAFAAAIRVGVR